ncbi:MAG: S8 family serine peptidase, partial [Anaerolineae bacterium]
PGTGYGYSSGTSMAGPHVVGLVALLISAEPALAGQVDTIETLIQDTAVPLTTTQGCGGDTPTDVPNHVFGHGRIDALAAYNAIKNISHTLTINLVPSSFEINAGDPLTYTFTIRHFDPVTETNQIVITSTLPSNTQLITGTTPFTLTNNTVRWEFGNLKANDIITLELEIQVPITFKEAALINAKYGVVSQDARAKGVPVSVTVNPVYLVLFSE